MRISDWSSDVCSSDLAGLEDDGVIGSEAGEGVDVGVGVVALEVAVVEPQHAVLGEQAGQPFAQFAARGLRVAFVQAPPGGQEGAVAVGFAGYGFQCKLKVMWKSDVLGKS